MTNFGPTKRFHYEPLTIRRATAADAGAVFGLAQLDERRAPTGDVLVASVGEEVWAAVSLDDFHVVADPFRPAGDLIFTLLERARSVRRAERPARRRRQRLPRLRAA